MTTKTKKKNEAADAAATVKETTLDKLRKVHAAWKKAAADTDATTTALAGPPAALVISPGAQVMTKSFGRLICSKCGAGTDAACDCGVEYVPAAERAAKAVQATPNKSNRAIAAAIGTSEKTVRNVRRESGAELSAPRRHVGKDGKSYPAQSKRQHRQTPLPMPKLAPQYLMLVDEIMNFYGVDALKDSIRSRKDLRPQHSDQKLEKSFRWFLIERAKKRGIRK